MGKIPVCTRKFETAVVTSVEPTGTITETITKWPLDKPLTYKLINDPLTIPIHHNNILAINEAIRNWASRISLKIRPALIGEIPDCPIEFSKTDPAFIFPDGVINHATLAYGWMGDLEDVGKRGIVVNGFLNWAVFDGLSSYQLVNTITHEFGHILGLGHSPNQQDIMFWAYNGRLTLNVGDINAILQLYPKSSIPQRILDIFDNLILRRIGFR